MTFQPVFVIEVKVLKMNARWADSVCRVEVLVFCPCRKIGPRCRKGMDGKHAY
jgi:hypothetical protein